MLRIALLTCSIAFLFSCRPKNSPLDTRNDSAAVPRQNDVSQPDQSPMDMSWLPVEYPVKRMKGDDSSAPVARIIYSRPHRKNREIFGTGENVLIPYGKPWRLGANEATEIHFFRTVSINDTNVAPGAYVLYCIPHAESWTMVLNKNLYSWGLAINEAQDLLRMEIPVDGKQPPLEDFSMAFRETDSGADLVMAWANVKAIMPIVYKK